MRAGASRVEDEADGKKGHVLRIKLGKVRAGVIAMLEALDVRSDVRISRKLALIDTGTIDRKTSVRHVGIELFLVFVAVVVTVVSTTRGRAQGEPFSGGK